MRARGCAGPGCRGEGLKQPEPLPGVDLPPHARPPRAARATRPACAGYAAWNPPAPRSGAQLRPAALDGAQPSLSASSKLHREVAYPAVPARHPPALPPRHPDALLHPLAPRFFETFSFLPPMDDAQLMKQITYMIKNKYNPCVEFEFPDKSIAVAATLGMGMDSSCSSTFYSNRYWSMWKLPMYGATDADQVMAECKKCAKTFPNAFVRLVGFDAARQVSATPRRACWQLGNQGWARNTSNSPRLRPPPLSRAHSVRWLASSPTARPVARPCPSTSAAWSPTREPH